MKSSIADLRKEYSKKILDESHVDKDPIRQFSQWFEEALASEIMEPNAMTLSTVSENGFPSGRVVLLKGIENNGLVFYTNYQSSKGRDMENNAVVSLTFFWPELERQVRIQGTATKVPREVSEAYFKSRPKASQIGAWTSPQSTPIKNRSILEERQQALEKKYSDAEVLPLPNQWGGYHVAPFLMEFWQGRPSRLHDRVLYTQTKDSWKISRLAP
ncbi:pyridoxamine 5'-phosphate oxidase [Fulvivirga sedimenti]|uniref:Pyridoxine/pyridoxamine 5'-phosphate oxidase n=1 Tax=Fulvivirga sedimenti TaxID=2879465 RepID=A0A9X1HU66_9BACT|nr:pyridoxamine 5'-phosphate oxidase [Fulvivirga sedimenti]MCA6074773.1 pyridoxamine 5'-phosphate oxidase [Fulvivirga sedimenti]MCA6075950.1 pyridoxamine 5'-phosphate oxidase [Fulvivirga sedimenti]MCA6077078.1 pyridoxamine 5'-phosphate oxidase [Fulvivirga sedimenti]